MTALFLAAAIYAAARPAPLPCGWPPAYPAEVVRVVDGDTIEAEIALGLGTSRRVTIRVAGLDAWEVRGPTRAAGLRASAAMRRLLSTGPVRVRPTGEESFGRVLGEVWVGEIDAAAALWAGGHDAGGPWGRMAAGRR